MTSPAYLNQGDTGSFFQNQQSNNNGTYLVTDQVDITQPSIQGLELVTDPVIPSSNSSEVVRNFDPEIYDLTPHSHLMRLIRAVTGSAGVGGLRKQTFIARMSSSLSGANFVDLDAFYGAIFNLSRNSAEKMPLNLDGTTINPLTDAANSDIWDDVQSRDARYRSRIYQLARAINMGGTYYGLVAVAEAILSDSVDLVESWIKVDLLSNNGNLIYPSGLTFGQITAQLVTYGNIHLSYSGIAGGQFGAGNTPIGNRGELVFTPRRIISPEEKYQLMQVLSILCPSNCQVTIADNKNQSSIGVSPRNVSSDSEDWIIQNRVTPALNLIQPTEPLYSNAGPYSVARPVFSEYVGEAWSYNANIVKSSSYIMQNNATIQQGDDQVIIYSDGVTHIYTGSDGIMDVNQAISARLSGDGVVTTYPYPGNRINYSSF